MCARCVSLALLWYCAGGYWKDAPGTAATACILWCKIHACICPAFCLYLCAVVCAHRVASVGLDMTVLTTVFFFQSGWFSLTAECNTLSRCCPQPRPLVQCTPTCLRCKLCWSGHVVGAAGAPQSPRMTTTTRPGLPRPGLPGRPPPHGALRSHQGATRLPVPLLQARTPICVNDEQVP